MSKTKLSETHYVPLIDHSATYLGNDAQVCIIPMGHATSLIRYQGATIITDPIFYHSSWLFKRQAPLIPAPELLPAIDYILISHSHPDHCDMKTLRFIHKRNPKVVVYAPLGLKNILKKTGISTVHEYTWWQSDQINLPHIPHITFTFLPALHWSQRGIFDYNRTLWGSWMIQIGGKTIYFAGDTAYGKHFADIHEQFPHIDCALLPIAPGEPRSLMQHTHMDAEEALQAFLDLQKPFFIPIHWGVFDFGSESLTHQLSVLMQRMEEVGESARLTGMTIGKAIVLEHTQELPTTRPYVPLTSSK